MLQIEKTLQDSLRTPVIRELTPVSIVLCCAKSSLVAYAWLSSGKKSTQRFHLAQAMYVLEYLVRHSVRRIDSAAFRQKSIRLWWQ